MENHESVRSYTIIVYIISEQYLNEDFKAIYLKLNTILGFALTQNDILSKTLKLNQII